MTFGRDELDAITREILIPERTLVDLLPQAQALREFFEGITRFNIDPARDIAVGQTRLDSGLAISPVLAAMCIREAFRTLAFIRGLADAIADAQCPDRPVRVLYAGCGPFALLAVPLMTVFSSEQVQFTLLDIHQECLDDAAALIQSLGLSVHVDVVVCADATRYEIPAECCPDVIVSETMAVCLHNEPQVSVFRHLFSQAPEAKLVPQSVTIDMCLLDWSKEHVLVSADHVGDIPSPQRDRLNLGRVFELDGANILCWQTIDEDYLPAGRVQIPEMVDGRYRPYLLTNIVVYGENRLQDYDSSLTMPQPLPGRPTFTGGETLQFRYRLGSNPQLEFEVSRQEKKEF